MTRRNKKLTKILNSISEREIYQFIISHFKLFGHDVPSEIPEVWQKNVRRILAFQKVVRGFYFDGEVLRDWEAALLILNSKIPEGYGILEAKKLAKARRIMLEAYRPFSYSSTSDFEGEFHDREACFFSGWKILRGYHQNREEVRYFGGGKTPVVFQWGSLEEGLAWLELSWRPVWAFHTEGQAFPDAK